MPSDDYASVGGSGALKLKGAKVQKAKKKKKDKSRGDDASESNNPQNSDGKDAAEHKTEAERRHEEASRKKMLKMLQDPKLSSDLRKTHKERVEGLNTYLSKLSEHHDMPKIGPG